MSATNISLDDQCLDHTDKRQRTNHRLPAESSPDPFTQSSATHYTSPATYVSSSITHDTEPTANPSTSLATPPITPLTTFIDLPTSDSLFHTQSLDAQSPSVCTHKATAFHQIPTVSPLPSFIPYQTPPSSSSMNQSHSTSSSSTIHSRSTSLSASALSPISIRHNSFNPSPIPTTSWSKLPRRQAPIPGIYPNSRLLQLVRRTCISLREKCAYCWMTGQDMTQPHTPKSCPGWMGAGGTGEGHDANFLTWMKAATTPPDVRGCWGCFQMMVCADSFACICFYL